MVGMLAAPLAVVGLAKVAKSEEAPVIVGAEPGEPSVIGRVTKTRDGEYTLLFGMRGPESSKSRVDTKAWREALVSKLAVLWPTADVIMSDLGTNGFDPWTRTVYCSVYSFTTAPTQAAIEAIRCHALAFDRGEYIEREVHVMSRQEMLKPVEETIRILKQGIHMTNNPPRFS